MKWFKFGTLCLAIVLLSTSPGLPSDLTWLGNSTSWSTSSNWDSLRIPTNVDIATIPDVAIINFPNITTSIVDVGTIITYPNASLSATTGTMNVYKHWDMQGTFNEGQSTVILTNDHAATTTDTADVMGDATFYNLTIDRFHYSGPFQTIDYIDLLTDVTVSNEWVFCDYSKTLLNDGNHTLSGNLLDVENNAQIVYGTSTFNFSGTGDVDITRDISLYNMVVSPNTIVQTDYKHITVLGTYTNNGVIIGTEVHNSTTDSRQTLYYEAPAHLDTFTIAAELTTSQANYWYIETHMGETCYDTPMAVKRYFNIIVSAEITSPFTLRFYYHDSELNGENPDSLNVWMRQGSGWVLVGYPGIRSYSGGFNNWVEVSNVTDVGDFVLSDALNESQLPVELVSFDAVGMDKAVRLSWRTESENDHDAYLIYRGTSPNQIDRLVGEISGAGTSSSPLEYEYIDRQVFNGISYYYQLADRDINGQVTIHPTVVSATPTPGAQGIVVEEYALYQNYPNPFNPNTSIEFDIAEAGHVTLSIYNVLGGEVATMVDGWKEPNRYRVSFDGSNLATGMYFYMLKINDFTEIKKMVYIQ